MALSHAQPDDIIDLLPRTGGASAPVSVSLLRTSKLQLLRLVLPAGHLMPGHRVPGELTIQCLTGCVDIGTAKGSRVLSAGQLVALVAKPRQPVGGLRLHVQPDADHRDTARADGHRLDQHAAELAALRRAVQQPQVVGPFQPEPRRVGLR